MTAATTFTVENPASYTDPRTEFGQWLEKNGHEDATMEDGSLQQCVRWWAEEFRGERETLTLPLAIEEAQAA